MNTPRTKPKNRPKTSSGLHPRNQHQGRYDISALIKALPELKNKVILNPVGEQTINFTDPDSVLLLNKALLAHHYGIQIWDIPKGYLCPPIPGRADYVHRLSEFVDKSDKNISVLDVGTGASVIYPIIGVREYQWHFTTSDVDPVSVKVAKQIVEQNPGLKKNVQCRLQNDPNKIFQGIIQPGEFYHLTMCNPPFHKSLKEAEQGTQRKAKNLAQNRRKRGTAHASMAKSDSSNVSAKSGLNFGGQKAELWCPGGEEAFIKNMAQESALFKEQVGWFSTLISKKENVAKMKTNLASLGANKVKVVEMSQGQKISRFIAWRFN